MTLNIHYYYNVRADVHMYVLYSYTYFETLAHTRYLGYEIVSTGTRVQL